MLPLKISRFPHRTQESIFTVFTRHRFYCCKVGCKNRSGPKTNIVFLDDEKWEQRGWKGKRVLIWKVPFREEIRYLFPPQSKRGILGSNFIFQHSITKTTENGTLYPHSRFSSSVQFQPLNKDDLSNVLLEGFLWPSLKRSVLRATGIYPEIYST